MRYDRYGRSDRPSPSPRARRVRLQRRRVVDEATETHSGEGRSCEPLRRFRWVAARPFWQQAMVDESHQLPCARPDGGKLTSPGCRAPWETPEGGAALGVDDTRRCPSAVSVSSRCAPSSGEIAGAACLACAIQFHSSDAVTPSIAPSGLGRAHNGYVEGREASRSRSAYNAGAACGVGPHSNCSAPFCRARGCQCSTVARGVLRTNPRA